MIGGGEGQPPKKLEKRKNPLGPRYQAHVEEFVTRCVNPTLARNLVAEIAHQNRACALQNPDYIKAQVKRMQKAAKLQKQGLPVVEEK
jgi:hypothetical protein